MKSGNLENGTNSVCEKTEHDRFLSAHLVAEGKGEDCAKESTELFPA